MMSRKKVQAEIELDIAVELLQELQAQGIDAREQAARLHVSATLSSCIDAAERGEGFIRAWLPPGVARRLARAKFMLQRENLMGLSSKSSKDGGSEPRSEQNSVLRERLLELGPVKAPRLGPALDPNRDTDWSGGELEALYRVSWDARRFLQASGEAQEKRRLSLLSMPDAPSDAVFTCDTCISVVSCEFAFDPYNFSGDCLAEK